MSAGRDASTGKCKYRRVIRTVQTTSKREAKASPPSMPQTVQHPPTPEAVRALLVAASAIDPTLRAYVRLVAATGMRRAEACAVRWGDLDLEAKTLTVARSHVALPGVREDKRQVDPPPRPPPLAGHPDARRRRAATDGRRPTWPRQRHDHHENLRPLNRPGRRASGVDRGRRTRRRRLRGTLDTSERSVPTRTRVTGHLPPHRPFRARPSSAIGTSRMVTNDRCNRWLSGGSGCRWLGCWFRVRPGGGRVDG